MKKIVLLILLAITSSFMLKAQHNRQQIPAAFPQFKVLLTNGAYYFTKDVLKDRPFVLIYFAPDCDHCTTLLDQVFSNVKLFEKTSLLLVTFKNPGELIPFEKKYQTFRYPNIKVGTEGLAYTLRNFYKLEKTPFVAVYDSRKSLVRSFKDNTPIESILATVKEL